MGTIFRTATKQAILDLIAEHATPSRFGQLLSDEDADTLASRVVDLFEMTLELRARTGSLPAAAVQPESHPETKSATSRRRSAASAGRTPTLPRRSWTDETPKTPFPTTVHADEFMPRGDASRPPPPTDTAIEVQGGTLSVDLKLPRTRKPITESERQSFWRRR